MRKIFTSIDIGSYEIKVVTVEYYNSKFNILASTSIMSEGVKDGIIVDHNKVSTQLKKAIKNIESKLGTKIDKTLAIVPSDNIEFNISSAKVSLAEDKEISGEIIFSLLQKMIKGKISNSYEVVNVFPIEYKLDGNNIKNPLGCIGKILEIKGLIVSVPKDNIYKSVSVIESLGVEVMDILISSFGNYYSIKNNDFDSRVLSIIDIGEDKSVISIFNKGIIIKESIIPIGVKDIENNLKFDYKLDDKDILFIKENFATANRKYADGEDVYKVKDRNGIEIKLNQYMISEIFEKNIVNILKKAKNEINNLTNREIGYIIITGGITNLLGFNALVEEQFYKNASVLNLDVIGSRNNKYSACYGAVIYFVNKLDLREKEYTMFSEENIQEMLATRKKVGSSNVLGKIFDKFFD